MRPRCGPHADRPCHAGRCGHARRTRARRADHRGRTLAGRQRELRHPGRGQRAPDRRPERRHPAKPGFDDQGGDHLREPGSAGTGLCLAHPGCDPRRPPQRRAGGRSRTAGGRGPLHDSRAVVELRARRARRRHHGHPRRHRGGRQRFFPAGGRSGSLRRAAEPILQRGAGRVDGQFSDGRVQSGAQPERPPGRYRDDAHAGQSHGRESHFPGAGPLHGRGRPGDLRRGIRTLGPRRILRGSESHLCAARVLARAVAPRRLRLRHLRGAVARNGRGVRRLAAHRAHARGCARRSEFRLADSRRDHPAHQ